MKVVVGLRGNEQLCLDGYVYSKRRLKQRRTDWICANKGKFACNGSVSTSPGPFYEKLLGIFRPHCHPPNENVLQATELRKRLRKYCLASEECPSKLINATFQGVPDDVKATMVQIDSIKRDIRKHRKDNALPPHVIEQIQRGEKADIKLEPLETVLIPELSEEQTMLLPETTEEEVTLEAFEERTMLISTESLAEPTTLEPDPLGEYAGFIPIKLKERTVKSILLDEQTRIKQGYLEDQNSKPGPLDCKGKTLRTHESLIKSKEIKVELPEELRKTQLELEPFAEQKKKLHRKIQEHASEQRLCDYA